VTPEPRLAGGEFNPEELTAGCGDEVLLVGHEPDLSTALARLTGARARMKKGGLAAIEGGELTLLLRSSELGAIAASDRGGD
jgi:phosphohistidine phosphatase